MARRLLLLCALILGVGMNSAICSAEVLVKSGPLHTQGDFAIGKDKTRRSLSGLACPVLVDERRVCLVAFDEGAEARTIALSATDYTADDKTVALAPSGSEMDSEAVAADDRFYYVAGSHAVKRGSCKPNDASHRIVKIEYDAATGLPLRTPTGELANVKDNFRTTDLLDDYLRNSIGKCLGTPENGFDIEGLAAFRGKLYFGLRGPTADEGTEGALAYVFEGDPDPSNAVKTDPFQVKVVKGHAIRDMTAVDDGILLLIGPNDDKAEGQESQASWSISFWNVDEKADRAAPVSTIDLGELKLWKPRADCDKEVKPEGMALIGAKSESNRDTYELAIFSDGMCDGGPVIVTASRSKN